MNPRHRPWYLALTALLAFASAASAQIAAPRIRGSIEPTPSVRLPGSLNPHIRSAQDLGPVPPDTLIRGVTLVLSRSPGQQADLDQLLADQVNPSSPLFHHWLTPAEFDARFGPAPDDVAATQAWLQSRGFTLEPVSPAGRISFSGTAAQIQQAFGTVLHRFLSPAANGQPAELHFAPATELALPAALAPVTSAILHLDDFRPKPSVHPHPNYTTQAGVHYLAPADIFTMYDLTPLATALWNAGQGQSIAVIGQSFINVALGSSGVYTFQIKLGQQNPINMVIVPGSGSQAIFPGDEGESDIDVEYSSTLAPKASIFFVYTGSSSNYGVFDALSFAVTQDIAPIITISYGECEPLMSSTDTQQYGAVLQQAAAQGQTVVASSGDSGPTACAPDGSGAGAEQNALAVNFPADSPYVTAVGGTQMATGTFTTGSTQYWAPADTQTGLDNPSSLLSYVPEVVWNESSIFNRTVASGGGASTLFQRPSWQAGVPGIPPGNFRLVPDIALQSSAADPGYIICSEDSTLTGAQSDCTGFSLQTSNGVYAIAGGTSFAAPIFAATLALLNQYEHANGLGNINPVLYSLAAQPGIYSGVFHDITTGTTDNSCPNTGSSDGIIMCTDPFGEQYFDATTGFDQATGLGTLDFNRLALAWPPAAATKLDPTAASFFTSGGDIGEDGTTSAGASISFGIAVSAGGPDGGITSPTGTVSVSLDGQILDPALAISAPSSANGESFGYITLTAPSATGSHILLANYPGDATHAASSATFSILVGNVAPAGSISISAQNLSLAANGTGSTQLTITPSGGYNGTLTWTVSISGGTVQTTFCYLIDAPAVNGPATGTFNLGVGTACDSPSTLKSRSTVQRASASRPGRIQAPRKSRLRDFGSPAAPILAVLLFAVLPRRRRRPLPLLAALLALALPLALTGCGGGSASTGGGGGAGSQAQSYTVTLNAQDSVNAAITASTTFTLTVE